MSVIDSLNTSSNNAVDAGEKYLKSSHDYYRLKIFQQLSISISMVFKAVAIGGLAIIGLAFMAIALAFYIGSLLDNFALGFVIVGLVFIAISTIIFFLRSHINNGVVKKMSKKFFD